ncbi:MAG: hypothetical protein V1723_02910 [Candidatus Uhrbacteria bacterium]
MDAHGTVRREGGQTFVEVPWTIGHQAIGMPGVVCDDPHTPESSRIIRRVFTRKRVYLPDELEIDDVCSVAVETCRQKLPSARKFAS